ncbi:MAG: PAS domain-containing protein [Phycisphaerales bacterium]|nr:PAS domain-containing protein [Phycisphaerales bacterium]MCI0630391.1 PAS domain-containing protein [Phycisphaerales bacterium]MCI0675825.1 PAS domain-containing protein [Phycisphaerales bacterium]
MNGKETLQAPGEQGEGAVIDAEALKARVAQLEREREFWRRSEEEIRRSEQSHRSFIEQSTEGIWRVELEEPMPLNWREERQVDHVYRTSYLAECNDAMAQMYGYSKAEELIGARLGDLLVRSDPQNLIFMRDFVRSGFRLVDAETHEMDRAGRPKYFLNNMVGIVEEGKLLRAWGTQRDITERKRAQDALLESTELQRMMLSELDHRVRNNLAALAALIDISKRDKKDVTEFAESIKGRVQAMSAVHSLLSRAHWQAVSFRSLIESLTPFDLRGSVILDGSDVLITPRQVTALGMIVQELMANSLKYGGLKSRGGQVALQWTVQDEPSKRSRRLDLTWQESGGPTIDGIPKSGQGTGLIEGFVRTELRGEVKMTYPPTGAAHRFILNLDRRS